jgi:holo-[acyl-carrier protein] synthase
MIIGIGVDVVQVDRFAQWHTYSTKSLLRIFSSEEIDYCMQNGALSAQRFAARFAAREAFFKALSYACPEKNIPFLTVCRSLSVKKQNQKPYLLFDESCMALEYHATLQSVTIHLSLTHTKESATAFVILEK